MASDEPKQQKLTRREVVEKLLSGVGMGAAWPLLSAAHPIHVHLKNETLLDHAAELPSAARWSPLFLSAAQNTELLALAEGIVPGSTAAAVNRFIDLLLSVEAGENQKKFIASLAAVDHEAKARFEKSFSALTAAEQESLLTTFSRAAASRGHFDNLKEWISGAYYSSEPGMHELGWDGTYAFRSYPECGQGSGTD
ncbi:MAG: gluconate 2-dehydrogenase subunit 3 family protein [Candidatus Acidiferrum sp.]|jgi:hypothetical protein